MSYSFKLLSHENKLLKEHLENVGTMAKTFIENLDIENREIFGTIAYLIGITHDFAKATSFFQEKILNNKITEKARHSYLSSLFSYWVMDKWLKKNALSKPFYHVPVFSWFIVAKHHGDLEKFGEVMENIKNSQILSEQVENIKKYSLEEVSNIYDKLLKPVKLEINICEFLKNFQSILEQLEERIEKQEEILIENKDPKYYFELILLFSALVDADKIEASCEDKEYKRILREITKRKEINKNLVDEYKKIFFKSDSEINRLREKAYKEVMEKLENIDIYRDKIFSIELPTGMGKTLTAFSFALKLREKIKEKKGYLPRIIYSLPFLSIIDQNSKVLSEVLVREKISYKKYLKLPAKKKEKFLDKIATNIFLKHHHLSDIKYTMESNNEDLKEFEKDKALLLIEGWYSEIIITTFVQLFESLISTKNRALRKVHNIANSIIILDEFQSIPCEYWKLTRNVLRFIAEKWNCYIIIMTATMPMILDKTEVVPLVENPEKYFRNKHLNRYELETNLTKKSIEEFSEELIEKIRKEQNSILVVVNTVKCSQRLYELVEAGLKNCGFNLKNTTWYGAAEFENLELINLNSNIVPLHRLKRIEKIKGERKRKVIIATQLVEAGVDIDVDIVYRDFAPIDSIIQSAGRCNRNNKKKKGRVFLIRLVDERGHAYSRKIYGNIQENIADRILKDVKRIKEIDIKSYIEKHFTEITIREDVGKCLKELLKLNFLEISNFSLIKEETGKEDFCVCFDGAKSIIDDIRKLKEELKGAKYKNRFQIIAEIKRLRKSLEQFIISPWVKSENIAYQPDKTLWNIRIIEDPQEAKDIYDLEKGFISDLKDEFEHRCL